MIRLYQGKDDLLEKTEQEQAIGTVKKKIEGFFDMKNVYFLFGSGTSTDAIPKMSILSKEIPNTSIWEKLLICYFVGMTVSRIGTFVFESWPSHIKWKWLGIQLIDYPTLIKAEKKDPKINSLLQVSNTYRSMSAASFSLLLVAILNYYFNLGFKLPCGLHILNLFLCILFYFSFKKQYWYVNERVKNAD